MAASVPVRHCRPTPELRGRRLRRSLSNDGFGGMPARNQGDRNGIRNLRHEHQRRPRQG